MILLNGKVLLLLELLEDIKIVSLYRMKCPCGFCFLIKSNEYSVKLKNAMQSFWGNRESVILNIGGIYVKEIDFANLSSFSLDVTPTLNLVEDIQRQQDANLRALESTRCAKEKEELRRHNELVAALKEAGENGATIIIGDNAKDIQIQQNSSGSQQTMVGQNGLNYEQVLLILSEIKEYFDFPQFEKDFRDSVESMKRMVNSTMEAVSAHEDEGLIKKSLRVIRDIAVNAAGGLISSGIIALISSLQIG